MPPRSLLTTSFSVTDANNEVVCPLKNHDGSSCRKRCTGEKRYRSMQEHIRRAHPKYYIPKLPATEESFSLMINSTPSERAPEPAPPTSSAPGPSSSSLSLENFTATPLTSEGFGYDANSYYGDERSAAMTGPSDLFRRGSFPAAASAAQALAQLHYMRPPTGWDSEQDALSESEGMGRRRAHFDSSAPHYALIRDAFLPTSHPSPRPRELLPSSLARSPGPRPSLPAHRTYKPNRPRKSSVTENARKPRHESSSKNHTRRSSLDRKAYSAEPHSAAAIYGKRWEDLIEAAASATEGDSRDLTPIPGSPHIKNRDSLPPPTFNPNHFQSYTASPLQNTLTPPPQTENDLQPFPSVESSMESAQSGTKFHMGSQGLSDSSPAYTQHVQIYCAACRRLSILKASYACTECICGLCQECVDALITEQGRGRIARCPRCGTVGSKFKPFQLDIR